MKVERIFLDMDGVLADFYGGVCRTFGRGGTRNFVDVFDRLARAAA